MDESINDVKWLFRLFGGFFVLFQNFSLPNFRGTHIFFMLFSLRLYSCFLVFVFKMNSSSGSFSFLSSSYVSARSYLLP